MKYFFSLTLTLVVLATGIVAQPITIKGEVDYISLNDSFGNKTVKNADRTSAEVADTAGKKIRATIKTNTLNVDSLRKSRLFADTGLTSEVCLGVLTIDVDDIKDTDRMFVTAFLTFGGDQQSYRFAVHTFTTLNANLNDGLPFIIPLGRVEGLKVTTKRQFFLNESGIIPIMATVEIIKLGEDGERRVPTLRTTRRR